ncbi:hypothetical protein D3C73_1506090 [compost metagenome]
MGDYLLPDALHIRGHQHPAGQTGDGHGHSGGAWLHSQNTAGVLCEHTGSTDYFYDQLYSAAVSGLLYQ